MSIFNKISSLGRKTKLAVAAVTLSAFIAAPFAVNAGFFPGRPTFDYNKGSASSNCADPNDPGAQNGRCGSLTGPVFNSFVNTPSYGDEREFLDARLKENTAAGSYADPLTNVTSSTTKEVVLRMYVHNNANQNTNASGQGIARNTSVRFSLPGAGVEGNALRAVGYISASNATPGQVSDTVDFTSDKNFTVAYKPGSAILRNNGPFANGVALPDSVASTGTQIGWDALNGNFPGCFQYDAQVQITVVITPKEVPNLGLTKQVRKSKEGQTGNWTSEVSGKPGEKVDWLLNTKNIGKAPLTDVVTSDILPPHVALVPGSVKFTNARLGTQTLSDAPLFGGGYNAGRYEPNDNSLITFSTVLKGDFSECQTRVRNVAHAVSKEYPYKVTDDADVVITKDNCQPENPTYSCDLLTADKLGGRSVKFTASASAAGGATIKSYVYSFGDGTAELTTDKTVVEHTYAKDGQYAARVKVLVQVDNEHKVAEGEKCATTVNFTSTPPTTPPTTPGTPGTPTSLPNTGAGDIVAVFVAVTISSTVAYAVVVRRLSSL